MEEKINIFEGAKFGDKFVTRDGRVAIYTRKSFVDGKLSHWIAIEDTSFTWAYNDDGKLTSEFDENFNIVSHYQEPIDEEELNEISTKECIMILDKYNKDIDLSDVIELMILAYRHAYRKAMEGIKI